MPKMFVNSQKGTFDGEARARIAAALTDLGLACELLPDVEAIRCGAWVFFSEHGPDSLFVGGRSATEPTVALVAYTLAGGLDDERAKTFIAGVTQIMTAGRSDPPSVYVVVHEISEDRWGMYGATVSLAHMRTST